MKKIKAQRGFFKIIFLVIAGVLILGYFNIDLRSYIESPQAQEIISRSKDTLNYIWEGLLKKPLIYIYNEIFLNLVLPTVKGWFNK